MARIKIKQEIEIHRNPVEKFLMFLKGFIQQNRKIVVTGMLSILAVIVILIGVFVYYEHVSESNQVKFETIMEKYETAKAVKNSKGIGKALSELKEFSQNTSFGFAHKMSFYVIGNILFSQEEYKESIKYLMNFSEKTSSDLFAVIAIQKAAVAYENQGNMDKAVEILQGILDNYKKSVLVDQITYNLGRLYSLKGDDIKSRDYYNRVISLYPKSLSAAKAKKMMMISKIK